MIKIKIGTEDSPLTFDKESKTFYGSEKDVPFGTIYEVENSRTGVSKSFDFTHSTGPEFDPNTKWVYKCEDLTLIICNDAQITKRNAQNYLEAKIRK